jgi:hypothetical protein
MKTNRRLVYRQDKNKRTAVNQLAASELERAVATCLLFENSFYEKGSATAARIAELCTQVQPETLAALAVRARFDFKLRHVPLFLARQMAKLHQGNIVGETIAKVCRRPDETAEFLALYWKDGKQPLSAQVKKGLATAFRSYSPFQLAKWNRDGAIKLRDVLFLCHAKPTCPEQAEAWKQLIGGTLPVPDTWETELSAGKDKGETFTRLLVEGKIGYMALLMNLRNMTQAGVDRNLVEDALLNGAEKTWALPFRFMSAARHAPHYAMALSEAMERSLTGKALPGSTGVLVDVSGSMNDKISEKSEVTRMDAAGSLAVLFRALSRECRIFTFSNQLVEIQGFHGPALGMIDAINRSQPHSGTSLRAALTHLRRFAPGLDRLIVITDEQSTDGAITAPFAARSYIINVAGYKAALDVSAGWQRISGWSDRIADWISYDETGDILGAE